MGDLQSRRAIVEGIDSEGHFQKVIAKVPLAEMDGYSSSLRSITQGRAKFKMSFQAYEAVPFELQRKLIDEYSKTCKRRIRIAPKPTAIILKAAIPPSLKLRRARMA